MDGHRDGTTLGGKVGCGLAALAGVPLISIVAVISSFGDCVPSTECHRGLAAGSAGHWDRNSRGSWRSGANQLGRGAWAERQLATSVCVETDLRLTDNIADVVMSVAAVGIIGAIEHII